MKVGDLVRVDVTEPGMRHFATGFIGVLGRNGAQQHETCGEHEWTVFHPERGAISWYPASSLTVVRSGTDRDELMARRLEDRTLRGKKLVRAIARLIQGNR